MTCLIYELLLSNNILMKNTTHLTWVLNGHSYIEIQIKGGHIIEVI